MGVIGLLPPFQWSYSCPCLFRPGLQGHAARLEPSLCRKFRATALPSVGCIGRGGAGVVEGPLDVECAGLWGQGYAAQCLSGREQAAHPSGRGVDGYLRLGRRGRGAHGTSCTCICSHVLYMYMYCTCVCM